MSVEELILIKYFRNSFLATKVSFFNQIYDLCEATGIDYNNVKEGIGMDERIGISHTDVNTMRGYGGHCFPKDVQAILETAKANNVDLSLIEQSQQYNTTVRKEI
jgi:UDPglucose 6-dehydrogenase